jgi:hypothetical protein
MKHWATRVQIRHEIRTSVFSSGVTLGRKAFVPSPQAAKASPLS